MMYKYLHREFLNVAPELAHTSYILCHVEDSDSGRFPHGSNVLTIADCKRSIVLEFYLATQEARDASIAKINLLLEILGQFRDALLNEAYLIAKVEGERIQQIAATLEDAEKASESEAQPEVEKLRDVLKRGPLWQIKDCLDSYESITRELRKTLENVIGLTADSWPTEQE
jgi:hypothetical protein